MLQINQTNSWAAGDIADRTYIVDDQNDSQFKG